MARRRNFEIFSLSFLDVICCGFGAMILFFMILNANARGKTGHEAGELHGEVERLEVEVLEGYQKLVELRNAIREIDQENVLASGLSRRLIETFEEVQVELATYEKSTLAKREHVNKLKTDLKTLEDEVKRLSALAPSDETPGDKVRSYVGEGDRQYLTGLKVGGRRILVLVDTSSSMLADDVVNVIRRRNLPDQVKQRSRKWRQAVATVDWITTQFPRDSAFQIYGFSTEAVPLVPGSDGRWLDAGNREELDEAVERLRGTVPAGGTSLYAAFASIAKLRPEPDNVYLLTDGLPTQGKRPPTRGTISAKDRLKLFEEAAREIRHAAPMNVILFPMEGDPMAASAFWKLAMATRGAYVIPSEDWP
jgi:hypothetical protein